MSLDRGRLFSMLTVRPNHEDVSELVSAVLLIHNIYDAVEDVQAHAHTHSGHTTAETEAWLQEHDRMNEDARHQRTLLEQLLGRR